MINSMQSSITNRIFNFFNTFFNEDDGQLSYGPELVFNGGFVTDTVWTKDAGVTISGGECIFAAVADEAGVYQSISIITGRKYLLKYSISNYTAGTVLGSVGDTLGNSHNSNGDYQDVITAGASTFVFIKCDGGAGSWRVDNVSVKEIIYI